LAEDAKISFTVKTRSGDLFTVRGDSAGEFAKNVAEVLGTNVAGAASTLFEAFQGVPAPVPHGEAATAALRESQPYPWEQQGYEPPWNDAAPPAGQQLPASMTPNCAGCGSAMRYEEWVGKNGKNAGRQFKAWKCTRDKDHPAQWVN